MIMNKKKILILNGSFCEEPIIKKTKAMGYYVVTTGNMPNLQGHQYADEYIPADYSDVEDILKLVLENNIQQIISGANDFASITASYVAEKMGWPGHDTYENSLILHHKDKFKEFCYKNQIPSPHSISFTNEEEAKNYAVSEAEFPIIVKANDLTGGKGILKATNAEEAIFAVNNAFTQSRSKHIVIEPFLEGAQQSFITFISNQKVLAYSSNDCFSPINPYLIQSETLPAEGIDLIKEELTGIAEKIATTLNLCDGILGLQYIVCDGKPYIIETMRRCFGNQYLTLASMHSGFPWDEAYIKASLGQSCEDLPFTTPEHPFCGHHGIMATRNGIVKSYEIDPEIEKHIFMKIEMLQSGGTISNYLNERIAYIYYAYDNLEEMKRDVATYNSRIKIEME